MSISELESYPNSKDKLILSRAKGRRSGDGVAGKAVTVDTKRASQQSCEAGGGVSTRLDLVRVRLSDLDIHLLLVRS